MISESIPKCTAKLAGGNIKIGNMMSFSKLYGNDIFRTPYGYIAGTCGGHCVGCKHDCYVRHSYRFGSVIKCHARNTVAFRQDLEKAFADIDGQLTRKRKKAEYVRINQSGEIESAAEFRGWVELARKHPETIFYVYTKAFDLVLSEILKNDMPLNFTVLISVWHEYGLMEWNRVRHIHNVRAFVYEDGFDYGAYGLEIQTHCEAYKGGKLNHAITCDKCRKCFAGKKKVIGCPAH